MFVLSGATRIGWLASGMSSPSIWLASMSASIAAAVVFCMEGLLRMISMHVTRRLAVQALCLKALCLVVSLAGLRVAPAVCGLPILKPAAGLQVHPVDCHDAYAVRLCGCVFWTLCTHLPTTIPVQGWQSAYSSEGVIGTRTTTRAKPNICLCSFFLTLCFCTTPSHGQRTLSAPGIAAPKPGQTISISLTDYAADNL